MTKDEELTKYMTLIEQYKEQMSSLETQSSYIQAAIADYNKAKMTIEQLSKTKKGEEILLPIGGSTYIKAATIDSSQVLFDIGAGVVTEKSLDDAINNIDKRIGDLQKTLERLVEIIQNLQNEAAEVSQKAQNLISEGNK
jgi:prefoldin alpha subunit